MTFGNMHFAGKHEELNNPPVGRK